MILQSSNNNTNTKNFAELFIVTIQGAIVGTHSKCDIQIFEDCSIKQVIFSKQNVMRHFSLIVFAESL